MAVAAMAGGDRRWQESIARCGRQGRRYQREGLGASALGYGNMAVKEFILVAVLSLCLPFDGKSDWSSLPGAWERVRVAVVERCCRDSSAAWISVY